MRRHPVDDNSYAMRCKGMLAKKDILILKNFLTKDALANLQSEANTLQDKAFYCSQNHNVLLTEKDTRLDDDHPCNIEVISDKGCVPHDLILHGSCLNKIYCLE